MTEHHRYRFAEHANDSPTGLLLCTVDGAIERGVAVLPDDDLIVLYQPGFEGLDAWAEMLRAAGHEASS